MGTIGLKVVFSLDFLTERLEDAFGIVEEISPFGMTLVTRTSTKDVSLNIILSSYRGLSMAKDYFSM